MCLFLQLFSLHTEAHLHPHMEKAPDTVNLFQVAQLLCFLLQQKLHKARGTKRNKKTYLQKKSEMLYKIGEETLDTKVE